MYTDSSTEDHVHAFVGTVQTRSGSVVQSGTSYSCDALLDRCFVVLQASCEFDAQKRANDASSF